MSTIKPRHAVAYHALLDKGTQQYNMYYDSIRLTDMMVRCPSPPT
jgi:hypothetical protein